jgi:hypothetical protein
VCVLIHLLVELCYVIKWSWLTLISSLWKIKMNKNEMHKSSKLQRHLKRHWQNNVTEKCLFNQRIIFVPCKVPEGYICSKEVVVHSCIIPYAVCVATGP